VHFSPESFQIIQQAAEKLRASEGDDVPLNRCIELICADYLA
jgi:hypothetical protein